MEPPPRHQSIIDSLRRGQAEPLARAPIHEVVPGLPKEGSFPELAGVIQSLHAKSHHL